MSFFSEVLIELPFPPYTELHAAYGFVPNLFRAQSALPGALAAQLLLLRNIVFIESGLSRLQKESMLLAAAAACGNSYCIALQAQTLRRLGMAGERIQGVS